MVRDPIKIIKQFGDGTDWIQKENANKFNSYSKLRGELANENIKEFALIELYPEDIVKLHEEAYIHIHDLSDAVVPYCKGHDATNILVLGLKTSTVVAIPPKHLDSFFAQLLNFLITSQLEWAGAQAIPHLNTLAAPFVRKLYDYYRQFIPDEDDLKYVVYKEVKQIIQRFIYHINFPSRGDQTPFINITLNLKCPEFLREQDVFNVGCSGVYGDYEEEARMILEVFNEIMYGGDGAGHPFTFPIITISLLPSTDFSDPIWIELMKTQAKYGTYSFYNYIGTGFKPNATWNMCCHLSMDLTQLPDTGGRWAFEGGTGSIGVVTINMSKLGYLATNDWEFFDLLDEMLDAAKKSLLIKGDFIEKKKELLLPLSVEYGYNHNRFFRTIGIMGLNEMCMNLHGVPLREDVDFVEKVLIHIREWTRRTQIETEVPWNYEQTPGEGSATRLARIDKEMYGNKIFTQGTPGTWYYSTMVVPPNDIILFYERLEIEERLLQLFTGGTVFRIYLGEASPSPEALVKLTERIARNTKITYFDFACQFSMCVECKFRNPGHVSSCSLCNGDTIPYSRIVGYYRPMYNANVGKVQEIKERRKYLF